MADSPHRLLLLDTSALFFRAYFGVPDRFHAPDGTPINAVRGLLDMLARLAADVEPARIVACWDDDWRPAWRVALLPSYKAHRVVEEVPGGVDVEEVPDGLRAQIPVIREALPLVGIPVIGTEEAEADDVIGTLAARDEHVDVVTSDRDLFQLVDDERDVRIVYTAKGMSRLETVTAEWIDSRYGIRPDQYADFAVLRGDPSDGLPGVAGIGEKTAASLLAAHGTLDAIRAAAETDEGMSKGVAAKLRAAGDYLDVAPRVVRVTGDLDLPDAVATAPDAEAGIEFARRWGVESSMTRLLDALHAS